MSTLRFYRPYNAMIVGIPFSNRELLFFCDTGMPYSFSSSLEELPARFSPINRPFPLKNPLFDLGQISHLLGIEIDGFLGIDFFSAARSWGIDYESQLMYFNQPERFSNAVGTICSEIPLINGPVVQAQCVHDGLFFLDTGSYLCYVHRPIAQSTYIYPKLLTASPKGTISFSLHTPCSVHLGDSSLNDITVGSRKHQSQFIGTIGNNVLSRYHLLFDWHNMVFLRKLRHNHSLPIWGQPTHHHYGIGFQVEIRRKHLYLRHRITHQHCNKQWPLGTFFRIPHIDFTHPEDVNRVLEQLHSTEPMKVLHDGKPVYLDKEPLFC